MPDENPHPVRTQPNRALDLLAQLVPPEDLRRAREMSREIELENARQWWAAAVALAVPGAIILGIVGHYFLSKWNSTIGPAPPWLWITINLVWFLSWITFSIIFVRWLNARCTQVDK